MRMEIIQGRKKKKFSMKRQQVLDWNPGECQHLIRERAKEVTHVCDDALLIRSYSSCSI